MPARRIPETGPVSYHWCDGCERNVSSQERDAVEYLWNALPRHARKRIGLELRTQGINIAKEVPEVCGTCLLDGASLVQQRQNMV